MVVDYHSRNVWNLAAFFRWNFQKIFLFFWKLFGTPWFDGVRACPSWWRCSRETRTGDWVRAGQPQSVCFKPKQVESHISLENSWVVYSGNRIKNTLFKEEADFRIRIPFLRKIYNWNLIFLKNQNFVKSWIQVNRLKRSIKWSPQKHYQSTNASFHTSLPPSLRLVMQCQLCFKYNFLILSVSDNVFGVEKIFSKKLFLSFWKSVSKLSRAGSERRGSLSSFSFSSSVDILEFAVQFLGLDSEFPTFVFRGSETSGGGNSRISVDSSWGSRGARACSAASWLPLRLTLWIVSAG